VKLKPDAHTGIVSAGRMMLFRQLDICGDWIKTQNVLGYSCFLDPLKKDLSHQVCLWVQAHLQTWKLLS